MNTRQLIQATLFATALLGTSAAFADSGANGSPVTGATSGAAALSVTSKTENFNVHYGDIVRFTLADGSNFNWKFDTHSNYVNLVDIAPKSAAVNPNVRVYVAQPANSDNR